MIVCLLKTLHFFYTECVLKSQQNEIEIVARPAVLKGLGYGMLGGLTSIVTETYDGVAHEGITGFFTGLGWGLVGTIR